ncbi:MAG: hypothetical protein P9E24_09725 [Candidatus Competibacter sp.]|nr:hypothetical protein [Candidatus Competibacter sp.]MDG4585463.1 hypothetical protein [Candidatus Competibacter sp.]
MSISLSSKTFPPLPTVHQGTGRHRGREHAAKPESVLGPYTQPFEMPHETYDIQVLSLEADPAGSAPNWFGVSYSSAIKSFDTIHIFAHPHPGNAGMNDPQYPTRSGEWPKLFRYAEILGRQISMAGTNHITVVPFFTNTTYGSLGVFADDWLDILEQIVVLVRNTAANAGQSTPPASGAREPHTAVTEINRLVTSGATRKKGDKAPSKVSSNYVKNIVLSGFSRGRVLASSIAKGARGMSGLIREYWDFDGIGGSMPPAPRVITFDQMKITTKTATTVHAPPERFVNYHKRVVVNAHGDIPARMAWHAAKTSYVGK